MLSCKTKLFGVLREVKNLTVLKLDSEEERSAWKKYEKVLEYRALICHIGRAML